MGSNSSLLEETSHIGVMKYIRKAHFYPMIHPGLSLGEAAALQGGVVKAEGNPMTMAQ